MTRAGRLGEARASGWDGLKAVLIGTPQADALGARLWPGFPHSLGPSLLGWPWPSLSNPPTLSFRGFQCIPYPLFSFQPGGPGPRAAAEGPGGDALPSMGELDPAQGMVTGLPGELGWTG